MDRVSKSRAVSALRKSVVPSSSKLLASAPPRVMRLLPRLSSVIAMSAILIRLSLLLFSASELTLLLRLSAVGGSLMSLMAKTTFFSEELPAASVAINVNDYADLVSKSGLIASVTSPVPELIDREFPSSLFAVMPYMIGDMSVAEPKKTT